MHHLFTVGMDVDIFRIVSFEVVMLLIIIWLFAGNFIQSMIPLTISVIGKISLLDYLSAFGSFDIDKQSAGNPSSYLIHEALYSVPPLHPKGFRCLSSPRARRARGPNDEVIDFQANVSLTSITETPVDINLPISDHFLYKRPSNDSEWGYYLAGLIEGDGYIGDKRIEIAFHINDIQNAYYIKKRLGFGNVYFLKGPAQQSCAGPGGKISVRYVCRHLEGLKLIFSLINGKLVGDFKIQQLTLNGYDKLFGITILPKATFNVLTTHWLAGFSDAYGSFGIFIPPRAISPHVVWASGARGISKSPESQTHITGFNITLPFSLRKQKYPDLLYFVSNGLGGKVFKFNDGMFSYSSIEFRPGQLSGASFKVAASVANYFDHFSLLNPSKHNDYIKWRNAYRIIQRKEHLTSKGLAAIRKIKGCLRD
jgi:hypothetical protein